jgi:phosphoglycolate phosphatase
MIPASAPLLWDLDGTLADTGRDLATAVNRMLVVYELPVLPVETVISHVGKGARNLVTRCLEERGIRLGSTADVDLALSRFDACYSECLLERTVAYPGIPELLADLARAGRRMAVVTNKPQHFSDRILESLEIAMHFGFVLGEGILPQRKPDPQPLLLALSKVGPGVEPASAVMIGDSWVDVRAARNAGMDCCGVAWGLGVPQEALDEAPRWWATSVAELRALLL